MRTVKHTASFEIQQPAKVLFPLFSAEGERQWVPGWDYENIMGDTVLREDYVFVTKNHSHGAVDAIWIVKRHEPDNYLVQFYKIEPGEKIGIIAIQCFELGERLTRVQVSYEYRGLSASGNEFIAGFLPPEYESFIGEWKSLLEQYFTENP